MAEQGHVADIAEECGADCRAAVPGQRTWWKENRHRVYGTGGLLIGYLIGSHLHGAPTPQPPPRPAHSIPAPTAPSPHHTHKSPTHTV